MATFPFTFPHAGRTFSVVSDAEHATVIPHADGVAQDVYVRIVGIRGLHEFGRAEPEESNGRLIERIRRWYDQTYAGGGTADASRVGPS